MVKPFLRGDIVISRQGHDEGRIYIVLEDEKDGFVPLADGVYRPLSKQKRKRAKHLRYLGSKELTENTKDTQIKKAIKDFSRSEDTNNA